MPISIKGVLVTQSCPTLCDPINWGHNWSLPGSRAHRIFQARILERVAIPFSKVSSWPRDRTSVSYIAGRCLTIWATREDPNRICTVLVLCLVVQLCPTLCYSMVCSQAPLSTVILQTRILEWVAMPSSRASSQLRDWTQVSHVAGGFFTILVPREANIIIYLWDSFSF